MTSVVLRFKTYPTGTHVCPALLLFCSPNIPLELLWWSCPCLSRLQMSSSTTLTAILLTNDQFFQKYEFVQAWELVRSSHLANSSSIPPWATWTLCPTVALLSRKNQHTQPWLSASVLFAPSKTRPPRYYERSCWRATNSFKKQQASDHERLPGLRLLQIPLPSLNELSALLCRSFVFQKR